MKSFLLFTILTLLSFSFHGATITSTITGGLWSVGATWAGGVPPVAGDDVRIANAATVTLDGNFSCLSLTILAGTSNSTLDLAGFTLNVSGAITINQPTANTRNKQIFVDNGVLSGASLTFTQTNASGTRDCVLRISSGSVTISGNVAMAGSFANNHIDFTGNGTLNVAGDVTGGGFSPFSGSTVHYNGGGNQICGGAYNYANIILSGGGIKTVSGATAISEDLTIQNTAILDISVAVTVGETVTIENSAILNSSNTITITGDLNLLNIGRFTPAASTTINIGGNWNNSSNDPDPFVENTSRVIFNGSVGTQQISSLLGIENFFQLTLNNTSPTKPALQTTVDIDVVDDYDHTSGFLDLLGNDFTTAGANTGNQTFSLLGGGLISSIAGSNVAFISSAANVLTVTFADFSVGETTSEEINITLTSESSFFSNSIFYGPMVATKTGTANNDTGGGNIFFGPITFNTIVGGERWRMANTNPDIFHNLTVNHDGNSNFILGRQTAGNEYHGITNLNSSTAGGLFIGRDNVAAGSFSNEFFGPVNINVTLNGNVNFAESDATHIHNCIFNDVVTINSSPTSTGDVRFGSIDFGSTTFQGNGTIATGVIAGATNITMLNVTQTSGLHFTINCTGTGTITCGNVSVTTTNVFDGPISFTAPTMTVRNSTFDNMVDMNAQNFLFQTSTFNSIALMTKTNGGTTNSTNGGNVFNGDVTFTHNGTGQWSLGSSPAGDDYNGNVTYLRMNSGTLSMASTNTSTFAGNISTVGSSSNPLIATISSGIAELDGNANQIIIGDIARSPLFGRMRINKTGGDVTLAIPINISSDIDFTSGILNTDATNLLIINNGATSTIGSDASHVNGPMRKVGINAFEFPVGKGGFWRPISITGPGSAADHFTAEFFNSSPDAIDLIDPAPMDAPIENISDCEFWILDRTNGSSNVSVTLSYRPYGANGCSGVVDLANLTIARWDGATWVNHPSTGVGIPTGSITTNAAVTSFSPFALATFTTTNPLPIELINFIATPTQQNVVLNWQTASEINNDYFEIERSNDSENFIPLQQIKGAGNSSQLLNYTTIDNNPFIGINYYRLKQTDFDGNFSYSEVKQVNFISSDVLRVYPNPAQNEVFVQFNGDSQFDEITLTDITGKIITVVNIQNKSLVLLDVSYLSRGVYFLSCKGNGTLLSHKLMVE